MELLRYCVAHNAQSTVSAHPTMSPATSPTYHNVPHNSSINIPPQTPLLYTLSVVSSLQHGEIPPERLEEGDVITVHRREMFSVLQHFVSLLCTRSDENRVTGGT